MVGAINIRFGASIGGFTSGISEMRSVTAGFTTAAKAQFEGLANLNKPIITGLGELNRELAKTKFAISNTVASGGVVPAAVIQSYRELQGRSEAVRTALGKGVPISAYSELNTRLSEVKTRMQDLLASGQKVPVTLSAEYRRLEQQVGQVGRAFDKIPSGADRLAGLGSGLQSFGRQASIVAAGIALIGVTSFQSYAQLNSLQLGLENITGSSVGAIARFAELREVARLPGLGLEEAVQGDVRLQAVGFSAKTAKDALLQFGNAIALTGGGKFELGSVITQLTQMGGKARVLAEDLKPILTASPAVAKAINEMFGTVDSEQISAKLQAVGRGPKDFINDLILKLGELERVKGGPKNAIENFTDSIKIAQFELGKTADATFGVTQKIDGLGNFIGKAATAFGAASPIIQGLALGVGGFAVAIGPAALGVGTLIKVFGSALAPTGALTVGLGGLKTAALALVSPLGAIAIATAAITTVVGLGYLAYKSYSETLVTTANRAEILAEANAKVNESIVGEKTRLQSLLAVAQNERVSKEARKKAMDEINAISPEYLGNLRIETINTEQARKQIGLYTDALIARASVQVKLQQATEAQIAADKVVMKKPSDFVDDSFMSPDRLRINAQASLKLTFDTEKARKEIADKLGKERYDAEVKRTQDVARVTREEVIKSQTAAAKAGVVVDAGKAFDYKAGPLTTAEIKSAQAELSKLNAEIKATTDSVGKAGVPAETIARVKLLTEQLKKTTSPAKDARAELKKLKEEIDSITVTKGLKFVPPELIERARQLTEQLGSANNALKTPKVAEATKEIGTYFDYAKERLAAFNEAAESYAARNLAIPDLVTKSIVYFTGEVQKGTAALLAMKAVDLGELKPIAGTATTERAGQAVNESRGQVALPTLPGLAAFLETMKSDQLAAKEKVDEFKNYLGIAKDQLAEAGVGLLSGLGASIAKGENPLKNALKSIVGFIGDFAIKLGSAILLAGKLETGAAALTGPFGALFALTGPAKIAAGASLVVGGAAIKGFALEAGGLITGPTYAWMGETSKARAGGGEYVASVQLGSNLIGDRIIQRMELQTMKINTSNLLRGGLREPQRIEVGGEFEIDGHKLRLVLNRADSVDRTYS